MNERSGRRWRLFVRRNGPGKTVVPDSGSCAEVAFEFLRPGDVVGLGTGRSATEFIRVLARRVKGGFRCTVVPTSEATRRLARQWGIPLTSMDGISRIDVTVDGADEVDPHLNLIKGYGGALLREKIVAAASRQVVILVGPDKLVPSLGARGRLPVEVVPFAQAACALGLERLGIPSRVRVSRGRPFRTDQGNLILDCRVGRIRRPPDLELAIRGLPGVVGTGLFLDLATAVLVQREGRVDLYRRQSRRKAKKR